MNKAWQESQTCEFKRELMRVFRDMELVEHLGSGMRRILSAYDSSIVHISEHFFELRFPMNPKALELMANEVEAESEQVTHQATHHVAAQVAAQVTAQVTAQVGDFCREPRTAREIMELLDLKHWKTFQTNYLNPLLEADFIERTIPDKPQSRLQKYRLTQVGKEWLEKAEGSGSKQW